MEEEMRETAKREPMIGGVTEEREIHHKLKAGEQALASGGDTGVFLTRVFLPPAP